MSAPSLPPRPTELAKDLIRSPVRSPTTPASSVFRPAKPGAASKWATSTGTSKASSAKPNSRGRTRMLEINIPEVVAEGTEAFERYERALVANDVAALDAMFWNNPNTLRFGIAENLYG